jgi:diamine N-acetyltransferase
MTDAVGYRTLPKDAIGSIRPLWEALNRLHMERSTHFREHFRTNIFERRIEKFLRLPDDRLYIAAAEVSGTAVGYVVATVSDDRAGEIDSIYVDPACRTRGVGRALMERALAWLSERGCHAISVGVAEGNEDALGFYRRFGFLPRLTILARGGTTDGGGR